MQTVYTHFRIVDAEQDVEGSLVVEDGLVKEVITVADKAKLTAAMARAVHIIDGRALKKALYPFGMIEPLVILPSFIDLHTCFPNPALREGTLESAALAAVKGGYTTLVCVTDTGPALDTIAAAAGIPASCGSLHDEDAQPERVLRLASEPGAHIHLPHVSTAKAVAMIQAAKQERPGSVTAAAAPYHFFLARKGAAAPFRSEDDRAAVYEAVLDGTIDAVTAGISYHAAGKEAGGGGFSGLETAFAVTCSAVVESAESDLCHLSRLMSAFPAEMLGLNDRGLLQSGKRADLAIVNPVLCRKVATSALRSRENNPFDGMELSGVVLATIFGGKTVYEAV
jgi:dihydroorotase-like cyclic amidohydrolase